MKAMKHSTWFCAMVLLMLLQVPAVSGELAEPAARSSAGAQAAFKPTAEQRRELLRAQEKVMEDAEYKAALQRAIEAQRAADRLFFTKLLRAAPDLRDYILDLQRARGLGPTAAPRP
jgi:hypothetical protein